MAFRLRGPGSSIRPQNVPLSAHRLKIARDLGVGLDLAPQACHLDIDGPLAAARRQDARQLLAAEHRAWTLCQGAQQPPLDEGQRDELAGARQFLAVQVEYDI